MADRIGVIAGGRLIAEGTLDELRRQTGETATSLEDTFLTLVAEQAAPRDSTGIADLAGRPRIPARLARLGLADDGGRAHARTYRDRCAYLLRHLHACLRLLDGRHLCRCRSWFRHGRAGRNHRHAVAVVVAAVVAGHGVGDPRVLFALRSRSHPHVACLRAKSLRGAHGPDRHGRGGDCSAAGGAVHQRFGGARRRPHGLPPMAWSLRWARWLRPRHWR